MDRDARSFLWDIEEAAKAIARFIAGLNGGAFVADELIQAAVERKFEIIGEALNQLSKFDPVLARRIPDFRDIISFRNLLIHGYAAVQQDQVWRAATESLPRLRLAVAALRDELGTP